jgi:transcriptional regulator with XRE-family HTH domain
MKKVSQTAKRIIEARKGLSLSQVAFAERCGIHHVTLARWETGQVKPSLENLKKVAVAAGVDLFWLIGNEKSFEEAV